MTPETTDTPRPPRTGDTGAVLSVCVVHAEHEIPGRIGRTAIDKRPVTGRVRVHATGLEGDHSCNVEYHGGVHQALYGYSDEDAHEWATELARDLPPGWFGENLRIRGLSLSDMVFGARCAIGDTLLEVSAPRTPCPTFAHWSGEEQWVRRFALRANTGCYFRVIREGTIGAGDRVEIVSVPEHGVTVRELFTGDDPDRLELLRRAEPTLSDNMLGRIEHHLRRHEKAGRAVSSGADPAVPGEADPAAPAGAVEAAPGEAKVRR